MTCSKILNLIANEHIHWINIVRSFGCNRETSEDLVQEMYIKIKKKLDNGLDITYNSNDFNYSYVFRVLRNLFLDLKRKEKNVYIIDIDNIRDLVELDDTTDYYKVLERVNDTIDELIWYDKKVFEIIDNGSSIADLSRKTKIPYYSLYNTFKRVKDKLKKML